MFLNPFSLPMQMAQYQEFKTTTYLVLSDKTVPNTKRVVLEGEETEDALDATTIEEGTLKFLEMSLTLSSFVIFTLCHRFLVSFCI